MEDNGGMILIGEIKVLEETSLPVICTLQILKRLYWD
jgi:hypothetical protein